LYIREHLKFVYLFFQTRTLRLNVLISTSMNHVLQHRRF